MTNEQKLEKTIAQIEALDRNDKNLKQADTTVLRCGLMARYWTLKMLLSDYHNEMASCSRLAQSWEGQKCQALRQLKADMIPKVLAALEEEDKASKSLANLQ